MLFRPSRRIPVVGLLLALSLALASCGEDTSQPFRIGVMESLTGAGETYGTVANQAKQMAAGRDQRGGRHQRPPAGVRRRGLQVQRPGRHYAAYNKLTDVDGIKIILGTSCSGAMLGAAPLGGGGRRDPVLGAGQQPGHRQGRRLHLPHPDQRHPGRHRHRQHACGRTAIRKLATITEATDYAEGCETHHRLPSSRSEAARSWPRSATRPM